MIYFILQAYTGTDVSHNQHRKNSGEVLEKMQVNGPGGWKLARKKSLLLGLGIQSPWKLMNQHLDTSKQPHELHLEVNLEISPPHWK